MMHERRGWASCEAQTHDVVMAEIVIEGMEEVVKQNLGNVINPFKTKTSETFPPNLERNYSGLIMRKTSVMYNVYVEKLQARIACLKDQNPTPSFGASTFPT